MGILRNEIGKWRKQGFRENMLSTMIIECFLKGEPDGVFSLLQMVHLNHSS